MTPTEMRRLQNHPTILRANCRCCCHDLDGEACPSDGLAKRCCANSVTVVVNGVSHTWETSLMSFYDMVRLARGHVSIPEADALQVYYERQSIRCRMHSINAHYNPHEGMIITVEGP